MTSDYDIRGGVRRCVKSDRVLRPSDHYFSALREEPGGLVRDDYSAEHWPGPGETHFAWWESAAGSDDSNKRPLAPNDVLLKLFDQWADDPSQAEERYVLTLLLVRRRVFRTEPINSKSRADCLRVYCPRRDETYDVPEQPPESARAAAIQERLAGLIAA